jgi:hypothetical protein
VRWAVERLKRDFFEHDPKRILDIFLFKDDQSYESHTESLFHERPSTLFGFYSSEHEALIMNIATGGDSVIVLARELVAHSARSIHHRGSSSMNFIAEMVSACPWVST